MLKDPLPEANTPEKVIHKAKEIEGLDAYIGMIIVASIVVLYFIIVLIGSWRYDKKMKAEEAAL